MSIHNVLRVETSVKEVSNEKAENHGTYLAGRRDPGFRNPGDDDFPYGDWTAPYRTPEGFAIVTAMYGETHDLLLGRRTYDLWSGFWPKAPKSPMADRLNAATKYVATHRPESLEWGRLRTSDPHILGGAPRRS
jgi:hypothetical protein